MPQIIKALTSGYIMESRERMESFSLLAFEPGSEHRHLPSALLRWFKDRRLGMPGDARAARAVESGFVTAILPLMRRRGITHVCRVLGSWETVPDPHAPLELLAVATARSLGAQFVRPMRRTSRREPMSYHSYLSGRDAIRRRIDYVRQDLIWEGDYRGARFLVLDDIRCLGASEAVWAGACVALGGADQAVAVNLGATASLCEDAHGPQTDTGDLRKAALSARGAPQPFFEQVWISPSKKLWHSDAACAAASGIVLWWRGLVPGACSPCPRCSSAPASLLRRLLRRSAS